MPPLSLQALNIRALKLGQYLTPLLCKGAILAPNKQHTMQTLERVSQSPFMQALADGTLPTEVFKNYVDNDRPFLKVARETHLRLADKSNTPQLKDFFTRLANMMHKEESMEARMNPSRFFESAKLEKIYLLPVIQGYIEHLQFHFSSDKWVQLAAALPCCASYYKAGIELQRGSVHDRYKDLLQTYTCPHFAAATLGLLKMLSTAPPELHEQIREAFKTSLDYEAKFSEEIYQPGVMFNDINQVKL